MASVAPSSHGGDAGGDPPNRANRLPNDCEGWGSGSGSGLRHETTNQALRKAYKAKGSRPLKVDFEHEDQKTFLPVGDYAQHLNNYIGELVRKLPLAHNWDEIPESALVHIIPALEGYFNLQEHLTNQTSVVIGPGKIATVGKMVKQGLAQQMRKSYRGFKNKFKKKWFDPYESPTEARLNPPPESHWTRGLDEWQSLVDWWAKPARMARAAKNAENRSKCKITTHQGSKSFARGRHEFVVDKGYYEDLIETWRRKHSKKDIFTTKENESSYRKMKSLQDQVKAGLKKFKSDGEIIDVVIKSKSRENLPGRGRRLAGTGSSRRVVHEESFERNDITRDEIQHLMNREHHEKEELKKQAKDAQLEARLAIQEVTDLRSFLGQFMSHFNSQAQKAPGFAPFTTPLPTYASASTSQNHVHANASTSTSTSVPPPYHNSAPIIPESGIAPIPPLSPPEIYRCFRQMNPGSSRVPTDADYPNEDEVTDQEGDDEDGNDEDEVTDQEDDDEDGNQNNEPDDE